MRGSEQLDRADNNAKQDENANDHRLNDDAHPHQLI
eukprot:CAMPEP_0184474608 /NCGR_PEP_ID=MMETSP0740-20130409/136462_1 /TAXON_ID=385413 /ORGANISM="Thalassiosira miniscula, Strain CCMP1093" /LENGTH=35 /DNA_ID= /DNA_START= /DNA_END= /DNA_ORIENTATION=